MVVESANFLSLIYSFICITIHTGADNVVQGAECVHIDSSTDVVEGHVGVEECHCRGVETQNRQMRNLTDNMKVWLHRFEL